MVPAPAPNSFDVTWEKLCTFLNRYYYKPDIEGLRIVLCTYLSHFYLSSPPVWLSVIGLPGTGKTELAINPLIQFKEVIAESTLTVNSFLSGFGENLGILPQFKPKPNGNGIVVFPDLTTTLLSENWETQAKIIGIMRRVYDGQLDKQVGNRPKKLEWKGKCTCIAACTPNIEDAWAIHRDMGERWLQLRWRTPPDLREMAKKARLHEGQEETIKKVLNKYIAKLINEIGEGSQEITHIEEFEACAILLEDLRVTLKRENTGKGYQVTGTGQKQSPARTMKCLIAIAKASTALRQSTTIEQIDIDLAKRIVLDSIPSKRKSILDILTGIYPSPISKKELAGVVRLPKYTFDRTLEDLRHLDIITIRKAPIDKKMDLFFDVEDEVDLDSPYGYQTPKPRDAIVLNSSIYNLFVESKLLSQEKK